jgi:thioredoxin-dependent peroxiredoxin
VSSNLARRVGAFAGLGLVAYVVAAAVLLDRPELPPFGPVILVVLMAAALVQLLALWFFGELFRQGISGGGGSVTRTNAYRAALIGATVARLLPAGGAATPVAMAWAVRREAGGAGGAAVRATVLNYGGLLIATGLAMLAIAFFDRPPGWEASITVMGAVALSVGMLVMGGATRLGSLGSRLPDWLRRRLGRTMVDFPPDARAQGLVWGRLILEVGVLWMVMTSFGIDLGPAEVVAAFGISQLAAGIPGTPGGLGFAEAGLVGALALFGFAPAVTIAPVLLFRIVSYWLPAGAGLAAGSIAFLRAGGIQKMSVSFTLPDQDASPISSEAYAGKHLIVFFYPMAMTPGCTTEAGDFRDAYEELLDAGYEIVGISPDPPDANARFREEEGLPFPLLSDEDHAVAEQLGVWGKKKLYGKEVEGIIRSTFVLDPDGNVEREYRNVRATGHVDRLKRDLMG